ncbi:ISSpo9 transposase [Rhodovulum sulfidophilum]|uniref:ISSpo9 transposase n=1 Tax=Rhodovulum sulfidophilum TaxID=35806 RepID=A0A0D6AXR4_RHOSU|nr:ISSpo9 transposase [Rhodovulum sulfidophilum]
MESLPRPVGLGWSVPDFSMPSRRQETLAVSIPYGRSQGLLIGNEALTAIGPRTRPNGIKFPGQGGTVAPVAPRKPAERAWQARKHGVQGRKVHLAMGDGHLRPRRRRGPPHDSPVGPERLERIPRDEAIRAADGAEVTRRCHTAMALLRKS